MKVATTKDHRRLVLRLDGGAELVSAVLETAKEHRVSSAWVRGVSTASWVELAAPGAGSEGVQRYEGPAELLGLGGTLNLSADAQSAWLHTTIALRTDGGGMQLAGGRLVRAEVEGAEVILDCFEEELHEPARGRRGGRRTSRRREHDESPPSRRLVGSTTSEQTPGSERRSSPEPAANPGGGGVSWADVAAMSAEVEESEEEALPVAAPAPPQRPRASEVPSYAPPPRPSKGLSKGARSEPQAVWPSKGDFIQHRQFGLCKVEREDGQGGIVIKLESGIRKTIKLAYLEVGAPRTERGRRVFPIRPRRR